MKKLIITIAIVLGMGLTTFAQDEAFGGGGLFQRGAIDDNGLGFTGFYLGFDLENALMPGLPTHGQAGNQNAPLGTGIAILAALGGAYLVAKKRKEE